MSPEREKRHLWITIMGVPTSGKSILGEIISERLGFTHLRELSPDELGKFEDYYRDPDHHSYAVQTLFFDDSYRKLIQLPNLLENGPVVSEPPPWQHRFYALLRLGKNNALMEKYERYYDGLTRKLPVPDLVVYLQLSLTEMIIRLNQRAAKDPGRKVELEEKVEFWTKLIGLHEDWVRQHSDHVRIITIKGDGFNFVRIGSEKTGKALLYEEFMNQVRYALFKGEERRIPDYLIVPSEIQNYRPRGYLR